MLRNVFMLLSKHSSRYKTLFFQSRHHFIDGRTVKTCTLSNGCNERRAVFDQIEINFDLVMADAKAGKKFFHKSEIIYYSYILIFSLKIQDLGNVCKLSTTVRDI